MSDERDDGGETPEQAHNRVRFEADAIKKDSLRWVDLPLRRKFGTAVRAGKIACTFAAMDLVPIDDRMELDDRHASCDWGALADKAKNETALQWGGEIISKFPYYGREIWVVTASGWSGALYSAQTTMMLADEYD